MLPVNRLFEIQQQYLELMVTIEEADGEITPEIDQALQFTERRLQSEAGDIAYVIKTWEYWQENLEKEVERLEKMKQKINKGAELLKNRLKMAMEQFGIERINDMNITISFRKSEAVEIANEVMVPLEYKDQPPPKVSKTRIKEAIKKGIDVPGASLVQRNNLQIK